MAQMNLHGPQIQQISNSVIPQLEQQTLASNGGPIQGVSGATYTSQAYARSLQAALDQLKGGANAQLAAAGNGNGGLLQPQGGEHEDARGARRLTAAARAGSHGRSTPARQAELRWVDDVFSTWKPQSPVSRLRRGEIELERGAARGGRGARALPPRPRRLGRLVRPLGPARRRRPDRTGQGLGGRAGPRRASRTPACPAAMINAGGDIAVYGRPAPGQPWRIGIQHPLARDRILLTVELGGRRRRRHVRLLRARRAPRRPAQPASPTRGAALGHRHRPRPGLRRRAGHGALRRRGASCSSASRR